MLQKIPHSKSLEKLREQTHCDEYAEQQKIAALEWLSRRIGKTPDEIYRVMKSQFTKLSDRSLTLAYEDRNCYKPDFFGCACHGDPENECKRKGSYYDLRWRFNKNGDLVEIKGGCMNCQKWIAVMNSQPETQQRNGTYSSGTFSV